MRFLIISYLNFRSSRPEVFCKKVVLKNFAKFTGRHLCQSFRPATLLKKRLQHRCFPVNSAIFLRTHFCRTSLVATNVTSLSKANDSKNYKLDIGKYLINVMQIQNTCGYFQLMNVITFKRIKHICKI